MNRAFRISFDTVAVAAAAAITIRAFLAAWRNLVFPYDLQQAVEITLAAQGMLMWEGNPIYVDPDLSLPFATQAYFPGYAGFLGAAIAVWDDPVLVPRAVGAVAYLLLAVLVYLSARRAGAGAAGGLVGAGIAIAVQVSGLSLANRTMRGPYGLLLTASMWAAQWALTTRRRGWIAASVALAAGATWFHQTGLLAAVVLPLALMPLGRRRAIGAGAAVAAAVGALALAIDLQSGGWFHFHTITAFRRQPLRWQAWVDTIRYLADEQIPLLAALAVAIAGWLRRGGEALRPPVTFAVAFLASEVFTSGMVGAGPQHVHTIAPFAGVLLGRLWSDSGARWLPRLAAAAVVAAILSATNGPIAAPAPHDFANGERLLAHIRSRPGPVLTDRHPGLALAAGRPFEADLARLWELWRYAGRSPVELIRRVRERRYSVILSSRVYETPELREAIDAGYEEVDHIASNEPFWYEFRVLVPRPKPAPGPPR